MFDTLKCLWAGFSGELESYGEPRKIIWLLLFTFLAGWLTTAFAGWISFPSYRSAISFLPFADYVSLFFTSGVAGFLYFALAYIGGWAVEKWRISPAPNYTLLGARILGAATVVFLVVDMYMNYQGTTHRAKEVAGEVVQYTYKTPAERQGQMGTDRETLQQLQAGKLGGYGWRDPRTGIYHLNNSGKKYQRELSGNIRQLMLADSTDRAAFLTDVAALNQERTETRTLTEDALKNAVYGVYVLVFILCIVQAFIVETIQDAMGLNVVSKSVGPVRTATRKTASLGSTTVSYPIEPFGKAKTSQTDKRLDGKASTDKRQCKTCGTEITGRKDKKYCSTACRQAAWEKRSGKKLRRGRKTSVST